MPITLLSLNIEGSRHLPDVHAALRAHRPDVACLQEVMADDCDFLRSAGLPHCVYVDFALWMRDPAHPEGRRWGIAILSREPLTRSEVLPYALDQRVRPMDGPNVSARKLLLAELRLGSRDYRIVTTHYTWSDAGTTTDLQREDFDRVERLLALHDDYILCGDFNAPRGREMYAKFVDELRLVDHLPGDVATTIDGNRHRAGPIPFAVDSIFSTSAYSATSFEVLEGLSDHKGLLATLAP